MTTPKPIDQLSPEELRVECALSLGWKPEVRKMYAGTKNVKGWGFNTHLSLGSPDREFNSYWQEFPKWEEDANTALTLAHALVEKGWSHSHVCYGGETDFEFFHFGTARPRFRATATGPHAFALALCCAYLAVVRDGKGQIL